MRSKLNPKLWKKPYAGLAARMATRIHFKRRCHSAVKPPHFSNQQATIGSGIQSDSLLPVLEVP
jgi:hypothetical protein